MNHNMHDSREDLVYLTTELEHEEMVENKKHEVCSGSSQHSPLRSEIFCLLLTRTLLVMADYHRYLTEFALGDMRKESTDK
jgi:hypothetical protein